ncbi:hypothetical protein [Pseudomonas abietaniphila]|uniref:hypothetical protein n=1 Tax=Pseudomonas abietaniphila TaxID=89065 RepID=UPI0007862F82|nr:hypothetical protein [Pseudomonas abietaniphila]
MLFFAGFLWGMVPEKSGFFVVANVHDFFDICGAVATVFAVIVAMSALNSWKHQILAEADRDLARKVIISLNTWRSSITRVWGWTEVSAYQIQIDFTTSKYFFDINMRQLIRSELVSEKSARDELLGLLLECKLVWKKAEELTDREPFKLADRCFYCVNSFLILLDHDKDSEEYTRTMRSLVNHWSWFVDNKVINQDGFEALLQDLLGPFEESLEKRLFII